MRIMTQDDLSKHPYFKVIPWSIWRKCFTEQDCEQQDLLQCFTSTFSEITTIWSFQGIIALYYSNPGIDPKEFWRKVTNLSTPMAVLVASCVIGDADAFNDTFNHIYNNMSTDAPLQRELNPHLRFHTAVSFGHLSLLKRFKENHADDFKFLKGDSKAIGLAVQNGHLSTLEWLAEPVRPQELETIITEGNFGLFNSAAAHGHVPILEWLVRKNPARLQDMIAAGNFSAFRAAVKGGHLPVLEWLAQHAPTSLVEMVAANRQQIFFATPKVADCLLSFPDVYAHAEMHTCEYFTIVEPFTAACLRRWREEQQTQEQSDGVFDLGDKEARLGFYILRSLIRRNEPQLTDDILFLLSIPAIAHLVPLAVTDNQPNELLLLAISKRNRSAVECLMTLPEVRRLAQENNFYNHEMQRGFDLRALAQDHESSMRALTLGEQKRLACLEKHYEPRLTKLGNDNVFATLKTFLKERYEQAPATIMQEGKAVTLPFTWEAFKALNLDHTDYQHALTAYHHHKAHTAYRYLSRPNPWMATDAPFVDGNPEVGSGYSTFERYIPLICLMWLAADDKDTPAIDGHTLEGRVLHFIDELHHLGRAHNYDRTRDVIMDGKARREQYDDNEGDKPSCYSGVKRRLFQSVIGHPDLAMVSEDLLKQELRSFLRAHFIKHINATNWPILNEALAILNEGDEFTDTHQQALASLNVSADQINAFIQILCEKYDGLVSDTALMTYLKDAFELNGPHTYHALKFLIQTNFRELMKQTKPAEPNPMSAEPYPTSAEPNPNQFFTPRISSQTRTAYARFYRGNDESTNIRNLLNDYTKGNHLFSGLVRLFHGHANRHYVKQIAELVQDIDEGRINGKEAILKQLENIEIKNPQGSLARRIQFIKEKSETVLPKL